MIIHIQTQGEQHVNQPQTYRDYMWLAVNRLRTARLQITARLRIGFNFDLPNIRMSPYYQRITSAVGGFLFGALLGAGTIYPIAIIAEDYEKRGVTMDQNLLALLDKVCSFAMTFPIIGAIHGALYPLAPKKA